VKKFVGLVAMSLFCAFFVGPVASAQQGNGNGPTHGCDQALENDGDPYDSTCDGSPSQNGNGGGTATGKPCAGCVGAADNKNPKGQMPDGSDHNNGYECDGNNGIGKTNPAHTGCDAYTNRAPAPADDTQKIKGSKKAAFEAFRSQDESSSLTRGAFLLIVVAGIALVIAVRAVTRRRVSGE
jgi:hypothetical protein